MNFIKQNWRIVISLMLTIGLVSYLIIINNDNGDLKQRYDGLVVTDKAGKSYMLQYSVRSYFTVKEFDVEKMRLRGQ
jgi:hypothetical protein